MLQILLYSNVSLRDCGYEQPYFGMKCEQRNKKFSEMSNVQILDFIHSVLDCMIEVFFSFYR